MRTKIFIPAILILLVASCDNNPVQNKPKQETPKALEDKSSSYEIISKRSSNDLVESLYNELLTKDTDLKKIEDKIDQVNKSKSDSTGSFDKFNARNESYFMAADKYISQINDSLLKDKMKLLITNNVAKYHSSITSHRELLTIIAAKSLTISDLHNVLKIVKTLPLIEKYQSDHLRNKNSLEGYINQQDETIKMADSLTKM